MSPRILKNIAIEALQDKKAENIKIIDCSKIGGASAYFIILANGRSNKNVAAIGNYVADKLKEGGARSIGLEGFAQSDWILVDGKDVIVNIFHPEARKLYTIEDLWDPELIHEAGSD